MRFPKGSPVTFLVSFVEDEDAVTITGTPSVVITDALGASVTSGNATLVEPGVYSFSVAPRAVLGLLKATWTATVNGQVRTVETTNEVVSGFTFTVKDIRSFDTDLTAAKFPPLRVRSFRDQVESEFEKVVNRSFTTRSAVVTVQGDGSEDVWLGLHDVQSLVSVSVDGTPVTDLTGYGVTPTGFLYAPTALSGLIRAQVIYGFTSVPEDVKWAAQYRCRSFLTQANSGIPDRATQFITDNGGQFSLATAGRSGFETGIPDVDAILKRYRFEVFNSAVLI